MQLKNQTNQDNLLDSTSPIHRYPPLYNHFQKAVYSAHFIHFLTFNFSFHRTLASALFHSTEIALAKTANDLPSHLIQSILQPPLAAYFSSPSLSAPSWKLSLGFCDTRFSWFPFFFLLSTLYTEPGVWGGHPDSSWPVNKNAEVLQYVFWLSSLHCIPSPGWSYQWSLSFQWLTKMFCQPWPLLRSSRPTPSTV